MDMTKFLGLVVTIVVIFYSDQATSQIGEAQEAMRCVEKLLPCHPYIHSENPPPQWCCTPMKEIAENDARCLCAALNHPDMLSFINLTKENALNLLNSCGVSHDLSQCTNTASSSSNPSSGYIISESSSVSTTKNAALAVSFSGLALYLLFSG